jgi:hypothetical protein
MLDQYTQQEIKLAREIAEKLQDTESLPYHLKQVRKYKEEFLRKHLDHVLSVPKEQIKRSRAALYVYLINQSSRHGDPGH